ncbi:2-methoxy-6-polyprenyl-1,4-benzoquinol methylase [subsurface metagenome]
MDVERKQTQSELPRGFAGRVTLMFMNRGHKSIYENVAKVLKLQPEDNLLEVACGNGHFIKNYASHVHSVTGLDLSDLCVKLAAKKNKERILAGSAEFVQGEATQLPWEDNKFSVATSMASFMMFPKPVESLKEMYRVLCLGGRVVVCIEWNAEDGKDHSKEIKKYGMQLWAENDVRNMLKEAGFSDITITYAKGLMMPKLMLATGMK